MRGSEGTYLTKKTKFFSSSDTCSRNSEKAEFIHPLGRDLYGIAAKSISESLHLAGSTPITAMKYDTIIHILYIRLVRVSSTYSSLLFTMQIWLS